MVPGLLGEVDGGEEEAFVERGECGHGARTAERAGLRKGGAASPHEVTGLAAAAPRVAP
ncbi:hypothetical protein NSI01_08450 [Pimelobacter simplex]|nr:hypothetical protein NSI01_08450 [Pimelobacter simplex]